MTTEFLSVHPDDDDVSPLRRAAEALRQGALVAFPTETVYGLAANAACADGIRRLRAVKGRQSTQPFTVHVAARQDADAFLEGSPPAVARRFIRKAWPGPLTLVLPVANPERTPVWGSLCEVGRAAVFSEGRVGLRCPDDPIAARLLAEAVCPVVASSANGAGRPPAMDADQIREELDGQVDLVLDGGPTRYLKASTIVAVSGDGYEVLREGVWDARTLKRLATFGLLFVCTGNTCRSPMAEGLCKQMLAQRLGCEMSELEDRGIVVRSAGTLGYAGGRASEQAVEVCRRRGIDLTSHRSSPVTLEGVHAADYVFTMCRHHIEMVRSLAPGEAAKVALLDPERDVPDPIGGSVEEYGRVADMIEQALQRRMNEVDV